MKFENIKFDNMRFFDESFWIYRWNYKLSTFWNRVLSSTPVTPPLYFRGFGGLLRKVKMDDLTKALGIDDPQRVELIAAHKQRLKERLFWKFLSLLYLIAPVFLVFWMRTKVIDNDVISTTQYGISVLLFIMFIIYFYVPVIVKLVNIFVDRKYADSLCLLTVLFLVCEMTRDDYLFHPGKRRSILRRINLLAKLTRLLYVSFPSGHEKTKEWSLDKFKELELYVRENERSVIAPTRTTVTLLREKMTSLFDIYLFGQYGDDVWNGNPPVLDKIEETKFDQWVKRIIGFIVPGVLAVLISANPSISEFFGIESKTLLLIIAAWLILSIDAVLGVVVIDKIVKTAREIKNLK